MRVCAIIERIIGGIGHSDYPSINVGKLRNWNTSRTGSLRIDVAITNTTDTPAH
jgi:hypothetical protein